MDTAASRAITQTVIVGGGTAGRLAACRIAAAADPDAATPLTVTLVDLPDVAAIGPGEGTWPIMRDTLEKIGISEAAIPLACSGSSKQKSRFTGWAIGAQVDACVHPLTPPVEATPRALVAGWSAQAPQRSFADTATPQTRVARLGPVPRKKSMPGHVGALNNAYHLTAGKLARTAMEQVGVRHVRAPASVPRRSKQLIALRRDQPPSARDFPQVHAVFPAARYKYILYGMSFAAPGRRPMQVDGARPKFPLIEQRARTLAASLPTNRADLSALAAGFNTNVLELAS